MGTITGDVGLVVIGFIVVVASRAVVVYGYGLFSLAARRPLPLRWQHVLLWGGLRGMIALALVLSVPDSVAGVSTLHSQLNDLLDGNCCRFCCHTAAMTSLVVRKLAHDADPPLRVVVLDFEGVNYIDSQGAEKVDDILKLTGAHSAELRLARVKPAVMDVLRRDGVADRVGESNIHGNVFEASKDLIDDD